MLNNIKNQFRRIVYLRYGGYRPLVSVIVPNYNNEPYIADCLESILDQTYGKIEIIVADDCSTDQSASIIKKYANKHPKCIKALFNKHNIGVSANRNNGIKHSRGKYITTIDSDDYYYSKDKIRQEVELLINYGEQGKKKICTFSNAILVTKEKDIIAIRGNSNNLKEGFLLTAFLTRSCEIPINYLIERGLYENAGGYNPNIKLYEDWDLKIRIAAFCDFFYTGVIGTAYRRHSEGLSSVQPAEHTYWLNTIFQKNIHLVSAHKRRETENGFNNMIKDYQKRHMKNENKLIKP